jgi:hypothetical protein
MHDLQPPPAQTKDISHENVRLCNRLVEIRMSNKPHLDNYNTNTGAAAPPGRPNPANVAAASVNRRKKQGEIASENLAMYKRILSVKPSQETSKKVHLKAFQRNQVSARYERV